MEEPLKIALIGCGGIARAHVAGYADLRKRGCRELEYVACCDLSREAAETRVSEIGVAQETKPEIFSELDALIESGVADAVDICLPHWLHHDAAIRALRGGLHAMVEKPIGITVAASYTILAAARESGKTLATAEQIRRVPSARAFRWAICEAGLIGDVRYADIAWINSRGLDLADPRFKWRAIKLLTGGGMIMDTGVHFADMVIHLFGEPEEVFCTMRTHQGEELTGVPVLGAARADVEVSWRALIRFCNGTVVSYAYSNDLPASPRIQGHYFGTEGMIEDGGLPMHNFMRGGTVRKADGSVLDTDEVMRMYRESLSGGAWEALFPYGTEDGMAVELCDFARAIREGRPPEVDGLGGLRAKALCEACYESAVAGRSVSYEEVLSGRLREYQAPIDEYWEIPAPQ